MSINSFRKIYQEKDFYISTINTNEQYFYHDLYNLAQKCFYDAITKLDVNKTVSPQEKNFLVNFMLMELPEQYSAG